MKESSRNVSCFQKRSSGKISRGTSVDACLKRIMYSVCREIYFGSGFKL